MRRTLPLNFQKQTGNALFLILIAVALFAALSYAVTQSGRGGGTISKEQNVIAAAQIAQMAGALEMAVNRMIMSGVPGDSVEFSTTECGPPDTGIECTSGSNCLFSAAGGGATVPRSVTNMTNDGNTIEYCYTPASAGWLMDGVGTTAPDVTFCIDHLSRDLCAEINKGLGISGVPQDPAGGDNNVNALPGTWAFCAERAAPNGGQYSYCHTLIAH